MDRIVVSCLFSPRSLLSPFGPRRELLSNAKAHGRSLSPVSLPKVRFLIFAGELINVHGAFPKIDRWSSRRHIRERTLQDCDRTGL